MPAEKLGCGGAEKEATECGVATTLLPLPTS